MRKAIIYVAAFGIICTALGVISGVAIDRMFTRHHFRKSFGEPFDKSKMEAKKKDRAERITGMFTGKLGLSAEQAKQVKAILEGARAEVQQTRDNFRNKLIETRKKTLDQISALLNPEQKAKLDKMMKEHKFFGHENGHEGWRR